MSGKATPADTTCWTCHAPITKGGTNGRPRKFCNMRCNNGYKGIRDSYRKSHKQRDLVWPYGDADDPVVAKVNRLIPRNLPEQIRAEACQELAVALLSREKATSEADLVTECVARARRGYQYSSKALSLDLPPPGSPTQIPLKDRLDEDTKRWEQIA